MSSFNRARMLLIADILAVGLAVSLPWSTSGTSILVILWIIALVPSLDSLSLQRVLQTPAGGIPVLFWAFGVIGMAWADVSLTERLQGLGSFHKLLVIPLLMAHFQRSEHGSWVLTGFLSSCGALLLVSWILFFFPQISWPYDKGAGIPVKDYISQSAMFIACIAVFIELARAAWQRSRVNLAFAYSVLAVVFLANILFIATSRTALVVLPIIFLLFGLKRLVWRGVIALMVALSVLGVAAWFSSEYLRTRATTLIGEIQDRNNMGSTTSAGERIEFWKKSLHIIAAAPVIGHGTGTITEQFHRVATEKSAVSALIASNPHNQTFAVAIQLGLIGAFVLFAMWFAHFALFRGEGFAAWIGFAIVTQNFAGSLFNSHLFDFAHGWGYVIGVGIAGGIVLQNARRNARSASR